MKLFDLAKSLHKNKQVILVSSLEELKKSNIICHNVVIASGTSTPIKTILEIKDYLS